MRQITIIISLQLLFIPLLDAQDIFNYDQKGLITYSEIVDQNGFSQNILRQNALAFFESSDKKVKRKRKFSKLNVQDTLLEYSRSAILYAKSLGKYPEGKITYTIRLELKDHRYRYIIQNFVFTPYAKNRYAKFEAVKGKSQSLETMFLNQTGKKVDDLRYNSIDEKIKTLITSMNLAMANVNTISEKKIIEVNNDW